MSWRRFRALVAGLPADANLNRAVHGTERVEWTLEVEQLSQIKHQLQWANWQRAGKANAPRPKPDPRPGQQTVKHGSKRTRPQADVKRYLDSFSYVPPEAEEVN